MTRMSLPPGFRFHPTDVELIMYYLKRKSLGKKLRFEAIADVNIYKYSPWDLPDKSCLKNKDLEWFFFCPISRKYASGARFCRATETGYWKATGKDRAVIHNEQSVGMVKTLVYHQGHAPKGERTDWVMHEYRILEKELADAGVDQAAYVLVKVFKKSGPGPKNGAQYGAPFNEEEWNSDDDDEVEIFTETLQPSASLPHSAVANNNPSLITSTYEYGGTSNVSQQPPDYSPLSPVTRNNINSVDTSTYEYGGTSYVSQQPPGYSPLSAVTRNNINSVDTNTQSAGFHCNSVGTNSFVLSGTSNISLQPLSAVTHNNYYVDTTTQFTSLPTTHNTHNNNSLITSTFLPGGPSTVMSSANDVPLGKEVELESLLAMFTEQDLPAMPSDFNDVNLVNGDEFMELDDIYADLGDLPLPDWDELGRMI